MTSQQLSAFLFFLLLIWSVPVVWCWALAASWPITIAVGLTSFVVAFFLVSAMAAKAWDL